MVTSGVVQNFCQLESSLNCYNEVEFKVEKLCEVVLLKYCLVFFGSNVPLLKVFLTFSAKCDLILNYDQIKEECNMPIAYFVTAVVYATS